MLLALPIALLATLALAGEVQLGGSCQARGAVVRLGDIAEFVDVTAEDRREIEQLALFPAPQIGLSRRVTAQDVRETMSLYGLSLPMLRVTGECNVEGNNAVAAVKSTPLQPVAHDVEEDEPSNSEQMMADLNAKLIRYLQTKERIRTQWKVLPLLSSEQTQAIVAMEQPEVSGGQAPWVGRQVFSVRDRSVVAGKPTTFKADVERIARAVVARRQLAVGEILRIDDVEVGQVNTVVLTPNTLLNVDDAVGKEVKQSIQAGQVVQSLSLRRPIVVKRGELITVYSIAAGVQVKARGKALADAALGDVIILESAETKKQFQCRVTAPQEAMVFVESPQVAVEPTPSAAERVAKRKVR